MRIWSDRLDREHHLYHGLRDAGLWMDTDLDIVSRVEPARRRRVRFDVTLIGTAERHTRFRNWGTGSREWPLETRAATWMDWGWFLAVLFRYDPAMIAGTYDGRDDFLAQTAREYQRRLRTKDRSAVEWAASRYRLDDAPSPFADLSHLPPNRLVDLTVPEQVDSWLAS